LTRLEDVRAAGCTSWFQAYLPGDDAAIKTLVERVARAGFDTLVLTVDVPVGANRENNVRSGFNRPLRPTLRLAWDSLLRPRWLVGMFLRTLVTHGMPHFENTGTRAPLITSTAERYTGPRDKLSWPHVELMRRIWKGRLVLKGVLDPQDARIARESGVDGVIVSNHGGRQLDGVAATLDILPEAVEAVDGRCAVLMDGGIRRGTDVVTALALGADAVLAGRGPLWGLAAGGEQGARRVLEIFRAEIELALVLTGCPSVDDLGPAHVQSGPGTVV
jgi:L-lactate dehydrogenase (cytochrome)